MSRRHYVTTGALLAASSLLAMTPAGAAIITMPFEGVVSSATNYPPPDPSLPPSTFFFVGQQFHGDVVYDNAAGTISSDGQTTQLFLSDFNIFFGDTDLSSRFFPRLIGRDGAGNVEFLSGGASQGGSMSLSLFVGPPNNAYPTAEQLDGRIASFSYTDFRPYGGQVSGQALLGAVPEPASWGMLIAGFALVGGAMRRPRVRTVVRFA